MPKHYPYLIIGGGMTADAAARGIRQVDPERPVAIIGQEPDPPYNRPPLSKGLWKTGRGPRGQMPLSRIWRSTASLGVDLILGRLVTRLDALNKEVTDQAGETYTFDRLLLATGGAPLRLLPDRANSDRVIYYRTLADYQRLRALTETGQRFAVIGGGFIGSEIAAALAGLGKEVVMVFPESGIGARALPGEISTHLNGYFRERGIRVIAGALAQMVNADETGASVQIDTGENLRVDGVVAGLGIRPNTGLAEAAGLPAANGILVNETMGTAHPDIFAAGDVASFYDPVLGKRLRVEHEENANLGGMLAGQAMAGQPGRYAGLPSVYSALFDIHYDAVGELDPNHQLFYDGQEPLQKGVVYYLSSGRVRGVLLWNVSRGLDIARQLIAEPGPVNGKDLVGRIPIV